MIPTAKAIGEEEMLSWFDNIRPSTLPYYLFWGYIGVLLCDEPLVLGGWHPLLSPFMMKCIPLPIEKFCFF